MRISRIAALLLVCQLVVTDAAAQIRPEIRQDSTRYNWRTTNGVPLSSTRNVPPGSDGRIPTGGGGQTVNPATSNQFQGVYSFTGLVGPTNTARLNNTLSYVANARDIGLPVARSGEVVVAILKTAQLGSTFFSRSASAQFGSRLLPPSEDVAGNPLVAELPSQYWLPEPHTTNNHAGAGYYWSKHAGVVFAIQSGPVNVVWRKAVPVVLATGTPAGFVTNQTHYRDGPNFYPLKLVRHIVSGSAVKQPQQMYWTEGVFRDTGKPVALPAARVSAVNIIYNNNFPRTVANQYVAEGQSFITAQTNLLQELRTLWVDDLQKQVRAYNAEGRAFVELLGDTQPDGQTKQHLGFEIVDVIKQPNPADVAVELGDRLRAFADGQDDSRLIPEPILRPDVQSFTYQQTIPGTEQRKYHATRETLNQNDVLVHWLQEGVQGLRWPLRLVRYQQLWPANPASYSHYVRPVVHTEEEARLTAVPLPNDNAPVIEFQDPFDRPRAKLTEQFAFYSFLDAAVPAHRALVRFTAGEAVAFERVFSWLDVNLKATNFAGTVATNLTSVADYLNYPAALSNYNRYLTSYAAFTNYVNYTNYLAARTRGVNGVWKLYVSDREGYGGNITSWQLVVVQTNAATGSSTTNTISGPGVINFPDGVGTAIPFPSSITVSGVTNAVSTVRVNVTGLNSGRIYGVNIFLVGPRGQVCALMTDSGEQADQNLNLTFDDAAAAVVPYAGTIPSGTYLPTYRDVGFTNHLLPPGAAGNIGTNLAALLLPAVPTLPRPADPLVTTAPSVVSAPTAGSILWPNDLVSPRVVSQTVNVGTRIPAPDRELGAAAGDSYLAGHLRTSAGTSYHPTAYKDPLAEGFEVANQGALIPVNAIPGANSLEVWWFRKNAADLTKGFKTVYWPSVIGRYTLQWPVNPREIILASNQGSGGLGSLEAGGAIYFQNDPSAPGYNPNEEHALMNAGQAYALRDDLNLTQTTVPAVLVGERATYSSAPFVLLDYTGADGRPAMTVFKVLREKPGAGILFDYIVEAGNQELTGPMPLPLLAPPVEGEGESAINYNTEPPTNSFNLPPNWTPATDGGGPNGHYQRFTYRDRKNKFRVYRGLHSGLPKFEAGSYSPAAGVFLALSNATAVVNQPFTHHVQVSRRSDTLTMTNLSPLPAGLVAERLTVRGIPTVAVTNTVSLRITDSGDGSTVTNTFTLSVGNSGPVVSQGPLTITSPNRYAGTNVTYTNRPPYLAQSPTNTNSFTMRFYYPTEESFAWPGIASPPEPGSIVPYLRPLTNGTYAGNPATKTTPALDIVYRPTWPASSPALAPGQTLTVPTLGLPAVRGQTSLQILYQQSIGTNFSTKTPSVILHDPTVEKAYDIAGQGLEKLPAGVRTESYQGKVFFPNLPPHLAKRLFFDANRGTKGHLVFKGEFQDQALGEKYVLLNVLDTADLATVKALCPAADGDKSKWDGAIHGLAVTVETYSDDPTRPGTPIPNPSLRRTVGITNLVEVTDDNTAVDSYALSAVGPGSGFVTLLAGNGTAFTQAGDPVFVHVLRVSGPLYVGEVNPLSSLNPLNELLTFQHTGDLAARTTQYEYQWRIAPPVNGLPLKVNAENPTMTGWTSLTNGLGLPRFTLGGAGIQVLVDNYVTLRYRPMNPLHPLYSATPAATATNWSAWTKPALAEGWIKRVLAGINPFNQRVGDLFNNSVNTDASILSQAGRRWEGDVALNLETINNYGLIEIYETVLRRGRSLSIDSGINYGPANDALLLAAGYLSDLYMMLGQEAFADAANPTIGIGTKDRTYGDVATALFAFRGQVGSLLEEELALLRGRDEFLQPGTGLAPVYNRLVWNYTRGIDAGEVIYALNHNILDQNGDGVIGAADAAKLYPQGHGDAYGHYLTALKGYYSLLLDTDFDWVPRIEAVNILGKPVSVDYQDERKFAAAAASVARTGRQIFDLTWRQDYKGGKGTGWESFAATRAGSTTTRYWGMDYWASRSGQGSYYNWIVGNAILPEVDPDPTHEGIQKVDRTTVPELRELPTVGESLQTAMDNAEAGLTPLGLPDTSIPFDLNPNTIVGGASQTHFEQVNDRAKATLRNALGAFDEAKDVTRLMRSEQDSVADFQATVAKQEFAYTNALIELYGTPYPDDIGPGRLYPQGYAGPDIFHYAYVETPELTFPGLLEPRTNKVFTIDVQDFPKDFKNFASTSFDFLVANTPEQAYSNGVHYIEYNLSSHGFFGKPENWMGKRLSPGRIQQAISNKIKARNQLRIALDDAQGAKEDLDSAVLVFKAGKASHDAIRALEERVFKSNEILQSVLLAGELVDRGVEVATAHAEAVAAATAEGLPSSLIVGVAAGGDATAPGRAATKLTGVGVSAALAAAQAVNFAAGRIGALVVEQKNARIEFDKIAPLEYAQELKESVYELVLGLNDVQGTLFNINQRLQELDDADRAYQSLLAEGDRIRAERTIFRQRAAAVTQGFRTRDAAFRIFRTEKLERYKTLFDLAARYAFMAAQAYDYETGQLGTTAGREFISRIIRSRALGVMKDGEPQYAGSNTGDPGLSSALAEMGADWLVLKGRLGFNNPDAYGTTVSLRTEKLRILSATAGDSNWSDVLQRGRVANLLDDPDVKRQCLQIDPGNGLPVPGIILDFSTTIADGYNLFGKPLAAGDHNYSPSAFATKIFAVGVALEGYRGMDNPVGNSAAVAGAGGTSPADPSVSFLDTTGLAATPYIYLIPTGVDSMRSPPLGDVSTVRTWTVDDVTIPLPFNLGASDFSTKKLWQSGDSLTEPLFGTRKHQAFRPVSSASLFSNSIYTGSGGLQRSQYTNSRLIGRSVWNSKWKLVIPGHTLLDRPDEGLDRFIQTVKDVKLNFVTYSYSGN